MRDQQGNLFKDNPLRSRTDLQQAVKTLFAPLRNYFSPGCARVRLGHTSEAFSQRASELEGFARPLWGLVPLIAGGGNFNDLSLYHRGLTNGSNPQYAEYWGKAENYDQLIVEMAPIGLALAIAPQQFWEPLDQTAKQNLIHWLQQVNKVKVADNNWLFFRVIVNLGLEHIGVEYNKKAVNKNLERIEDFYLGEGWYSDGLLMQRDYYVAFAYHYYGLIYSKLAGNEDSKRTKRYRERAIQFAKDFVYWFAADGSALPFGRSLSYRFAQGSFWGALAFADAEVEGLPWGVIKGLVLRNLRWWLHQPIFNNDGTLSIGYVYPNQNIADQYISPSSPYWAFKIFLPLALPDSHPFWQAEEALLPDLSTVRVQNHAGMILCSDNSRSHIFALSTGQYANWLKHGEAKYAKFAYSTAFGFSVPSFPSGLAEGAYDSILALSEDNRHFRVRENPLDAHIKTVVWKNQLIGECGRRLLRRLNSILSPLKHAVTSQHIENSTLYSCWRPWADVIVETWLFPMIPWHIRIHRLQTKRRLYSAEGGFAIGRTEEYSDKIHILQCKTGSALTVSPVGWSGLCDLAQQKIDGTVREGNVQFAAPNTNALKPLTAIPTLIGHHNPGEHWLLSAVLGLTDITNSQQIWDQPPTLCLNNSDFKQKIVIKYDLDEKTIIIQGKR